MLSPADLLAFCNKVREAGGAETLDALMPGRLASPRSCLIARNLNFACRVAPLYRQWRMSSTDVRINDVAQALDIDIDARQTTEGWLWSFVLPQEVGESAAAFDRQEYPPELYETDPSCND